MKKISVDNSVLQDEADKFLDAISDYRKTAKGDHAASGLSKEFEKQAVNHAGMLMSGVINFLKPVEGASIIDIVNAQYSCILTMVKNDDWFFGSGRRGAKRRRFLQMLDKTYVHAPRKAFGDGRDERAKAKHILRECAEVTIVYFAMKHRKKYGSRIRQALVDEIVHRSHELISENPGCVVPFPAGGRGGRGFKLA